MGRALSPHVPSVPTLASRDEGSHFTHRYKAEERGPEASKFMITK